MQNSFDILRSRCQDIRRQKQIKIVLFATIAFVIFSALFIYIWMSSSDGMFENWFSSSEQERKISQVDPKDDVEEAPTYVVEERYDTTNYANVNSDTYETPVFNTVVNPDKAVQRTGGSTQNSKREQRRTERPKPKSEPKRVARPTASKPTTATRPQSVQNKKESFFDGPTYEKAISVAEYYYNKGNMEAVLVWAIRASKLKKSADKPWILYAKAKARLGEKDVAQRSLQTYLKYYKSRGVEQLLNEINRGGAR
jgi:hypothetical protein